MELLQSTLTLLLAISCTCWALQQQMLPSISRGTTASTRLMAQNNKNNNQEEYLVEVSYEGMSCQVTVRSNESILAAMERTGVHNRLAIPELPSECRRGNCLTCTGRHAANSQESSLQRDEDGLAPHISKEVAEKGYFLTCSSHVVGEGVKIELGENNKVWKDMYVNRIEDASTQLISRAAMAKAIRMADEKNVTRWTVETEAALEKSGE